MHCDNDSSFASHVVSPQCWKGKPSKIVTITYNEVESDKLILCDACAKAVTVDARGHGYKVTARSL